MAASIAVVYPHMNAIGGDGFWIIRDPKGKARAIEACGFAGEKATRRRLRGDRRHPDARADGGADRSRRDRRLEDRARALRRARRQAAARPISSPAPIAQAREGVPVSASEQRSQPRDGDGALRSAEFPRRPIFTTASRRRPACSRKQAKLAETLAHLAHAGLDDFYRGDVAREIAADLEALGSPVTRADLKAYQARWREPLSIKTRTARRSTTRRSRRRGSPR